MFQSFKLCFNFFIAFLAIGFFFLVNNEELNLKELHQLNLEAIDSNPNKNLTKKQRFEKGLPPRKGNGCSTNSF